MNPADYPWLKVDALLDAEPLTTDRAHVMWHKSTIKHKSALILPVISLGYMFNALSKFWPQHRQEICHIPERKSGVPWEYQFCLRSQPPFTWQLWCLWETFHKMLKCRCHLLFIEQSRESNDLGNLLLGLGNLSTFYIHLQRSFLEFKSAPSFWIKNHLYRLLLSRTEAEY